MNRYRIAFTLQFPNEKLEYYITVENDEIAKKYFLLQVCKMVKHEELEFNTLYVSHDNASVEVLRENKTYISGTLTCVPNKFRVISGNKFKRIGIETIIMSMEKYGKVARSR